MPKSYVFGISPRSARLIAATRRNDPRTPDIMRAETRRLIAMQVKYGVTLVSDPLLGWDDMLRWYAMEWKGIKVDGINRFFEHNTFYRIPTVVSKIEPSGDVIRGHMDIGALSDSGHEYVVEIPEPVTFALMSRDKYYGGIRELSEAIAMALNEELCSGDISPRLLIVKAPALVHVDGDRYLDLAAEMSRVLLRSCDHEAFLHIYFKSPLRAFKRLRTAGSSYSGYGLDLTHDDLADVLDALKGYDGCLTMGLIDSHTTRIERVRDLRGIVDGLDVDCLYISNSSDLEFLPYGFALKKLKVLGSLSRGS